MGTTLWIISIILPFVIGYIISYFTRLNKRRVKFEIKGDSWIGYYKEDGQAVRKEKVKIKKHRICNKYTISLTYKGDDKEERTENFTGKYKELVLEGKLDGTEDTGTFILTYVSDGVLYGIYTWIDKDRTIGEGKYALIRSKSDYTYSFCKDCYSKDNCCCNNSKVDMPSLYQNEVEVISLIKGMDKAKFAEKCAQTSMWQIKRKVESNECCFLSNKGCDVHEYRPNDCRFFPFDEDENGDTIIYNHREICSKAPSVDNVRKYSMEIKKMSKLISFFGKDWFNKQFTELLKKYDYAKIKKRNQNDV